MKRNNLILLCATMFYLPIVSVTFTQLFYHTGPFTHSIVLFIQEKKNIYSIKKEAVGKQNRLIINFDSSSLEKIEKKIAKMALASSDYTLTWKNTGSAFSLIITYNPDTTSIEHNDINSDRFGTGIAIKIYPKKTDSFFKKIHTAKDPVRIFIDCGHGGTDKGARALSGIYEKEITQVMGKKLAKKLKSSGYTVLLFPQNDATVPLDSRTTKANIFKADLCISLHADSCTRPEKSGISIRVPPTARWGQREKKRYTISNTLAQYVTRSLKKEVETVPAIKNDPFQILIGTHMPTILVEMGFLSNKEDGQKLLNPDYQNAFIKALSDGIRAFYRE